MGNKISNKQYQGKYVAFHPSKGRKVIASGSNPVTVIKTARKQGVDTPAIVFIPKDKTTYLY